MLIKPKASARQSDVISKVLSMLELMDRSVEDDLIFNHVSLMLEDYDEKKVENEQLLCSLISLILGSLSIHLSPGDTLSTQIKMLQFRLMAPVTSTEHVALQHYVETCADLITQKNDVSHLEIEKMLEPLLNSFGLHNREQHVKSLKKTEAVAKQHNDAILSDNSDNQHYWEVDVSEFGKSLKQLFSSNYLISSIEQSEKFGALLEVELATLKHLDEPSSFNERKAQVIRELEKILHGHQEMTGYFHKMSDFVSVVQRDSVRLNAELDRVTLLSMTDELTELPNRRAFQQRLKDEVGRVKRYGHNLSLAMIDLDNFKPINDRYGHSAGDRVLKAYASDVLTMFREQDMIARFGGEEFVVIFPNTDISGALQALSMVQGRAKSITLSLGGENIQLPTFSAGLINFESGESIESFVQRADEALYEAKRKGRNRVEVKHRIKETI